MLLKRSPNNEEGRGGKRPRGTLPVTYSFISDDGNRKCSACEKENRIPSDDCIGFDLAPTTYFRLALTITDPTADDVQQDNQDWTLQALAIYARRLAVESELALNVILMLHPLLANCSREGISKLVSVVKKTKLHHARELRFIQSCLLSVKETTYALVQSQFESSVREMIDLGKIILSDVRYARLFPLLCILKDANSITEDNAITSDQDDSQDMEYLHSTDNYQVSQDGAYDILDSNDDSIIDMTQDSYAFVIAPSVIESSYPLTTEQEGSGLGFASDIFDSRHSSQTPHASSLDLPSPDSLLIPDSQYEISVNSSPSTIVSLVADSQQQQQQPDTPDYEELSTAELKAKLKTYGFKTSNNRSQMIKDLKGIFVSISSQNNSERILSQSTTSAAKSPISTGSQTVGGLDPNKRKEIIAHLKSNTEIWNRIAMYNTVSLDECLVGISCKQSEMKMVLDEFAAVKGNNKRNQSKK